MLFDGNEKYIGRLLRIFVHSWANDDRKKDEHDGQSPEVRDMAADVEDVTSIGSNRVEIGYEVGSRA